MTTASVIKELIEPSTSSTDKVELIEDSKDSILPSEFRFINLSILLDVFSLLTSPNCLIRRNTLKLHETEDKTKGLARFMKIKCRDCEFKHNF